ncbi:MAG: cell division protein FtsZ [Magnetovibrio sp.]|nr:cell division protein FtsZ [Magnetovibrio sp.]
MSINLSIPENFEHTELKPRITVVGVGGAGGNAVNNMIRKELAGVDFIVANSDAQALLQSRADRRIQLGATLTEGLGAGSKPDVGAAAAKEAHEELLNELSGAHMVFLAAGMGGGTGTGAAPVIAKAAKDAGILTVAVVTKPFHFEGTHRMSLAESGIDELAQYVDTLIIIPNQNLFRVATENTTFADAFATADEVLYSGVRGVTDLMVMPGLINLDFADIRSVMIEMGKAMMGTGEATGERRALEAAEAAIANPLLDDTSMKGAKGVLINITGGPDITLFEVDEAATRIRAEVDQDAYIIIGSAFDSELDGVMRVSVVATGIDGGGYVMPQSSILQVTEAIGKERVLANNNSESEEEKNITLLEQSEMTEAVAPELENLKRSKENKETSLPDWRETVESNIDNNQALEAVEALQSNSDGDSGSTVALQETNLRKEPVSPMAPVAMPRVGNEDAFVPTEPETGNVSDDDKKPDPFAAAAMANGSGVTQKKSLAAEKDRPSLFERVTRTGRAAIDRKSENLVSSDAVSVIENTLGEPQKVAPINPGVSEETESGINSVSNKVGDEDTTEQLSEQSEISDLGLVQARTSDEDDLLDIPAFLRRQAN